MGNRRMMERARTLAVMTFALPLIPYTCIWIDMISMVPQLWQFPDSNMILSLRITLTKFRPNRSSVSVPQTHRKCILLK